MGPRRTRSSNFLDVIAVAPVAPNALRGRGKIGVLPCAPNPQFPQQQKRRGIYGSRRCPVAMTRTATSVCHGTRTCTRRGSCGPVPISRIKPCSTTRARRVRVARIVSPIAAAICSVARPLLSNSTIMIAVSGPSTFVGATRVIEIVTRKRSAISSKRGGARPAVRDRRCRMPPACVECHYPIVQ